MLSAATIHAVIAMISDQKWIGYKHGGYTDNNPCSEEAGCDDQRRVSVAQIAHDCDNDPLNPQPDDRKCELCQAPTKVSAINHI